MKKVMTRAIVIVSFLTVVLVCATACGKKGNPRPPQNFAPDSVRFLTATGKTNGVLLSWLPPLVTQDGDKLADLDLFLVERGEVEDERKTQFEKIAEVRFERKEKPQTAEVKETAADRLSYMDDDVSPGVRYEYRITALNERKMKGSSTNVVRVFFTGESSIIEVF